MTAKGRMVDFMAEGGTAKGYLASPEKPRGGVLVLHAWWGLNDFFRGYANRLASQGFLALAPDLHDGPVASTVEEAKDLHSKVDEGRVSKIVLGAADYLQSMPSISGRKLGAVGFSMGGAHSLLLSTLKPESVGAVVLFYAAGAAPGVAKARAVFLGHFAPEDEWEP